MQPATRKDYVWASNLFLASTAFYLLPTLYTISKLLGAFTAEKSIDYGIFCVMVLISALFIAAFIWLGLGIRSGKTWAKILYSIYFAWVLFVFMRELPLILQQNLWSIARRLFALSTLFATAFLLFKDLLLRKPESPDAGVAGGGYDRLN
ncbi:hypothetical protein CLV45_0828 [Hymenobacter chitinivorans DSM 11115]|uniref:Uncharacterized protein n=1 Tax=Hymenobacter chitinivorans DSM 11115 TaxID=1121954 RepID=A0A2M9BN78_9BACT|nr:hypothetical protein CLV45_0828 [Hymenobacter chitinivorans DSM 11115]